MSGKKIAGIIILVLGLAVLIISLFANVIEVGPVGKNPGFGIRQITGTIIGVILVAFGSVFTFKK